MGAVITTARDGLLPSATAWQEAEFRLDGSRGFSEGTAQVWEVLKESTRDESQQQETVPKL